MTPFLQFAMPGDVYQTADHRAAQLVAFRSQDILVQTSNGHRWLVDAYGQAKSGDEKDNIIELGNV